MPNIKNATYNFKAVPEASWYTLGLAIGGVVTAVCIILGAPEIPSGGLGLAIAGLFRPIAGIFLPAPDTTGKQGDKST